MNNIKFDYDESDKERFVLDEKHQSSRKDFERDRARILHSSALRRLGTKTQVLSPDFDDFARTRLTHTLEVAQVGRDLANVLKCNPDLVEVACLAHDLGHPPFGHNGETALNKIAENIGGFEGNAQTLRIITRLEGKVYDDELKRSYGLNLTRASIDSCIKYPWTSEMSKNHPTADRSTKFGIYEDDQYIFDWVRKDVLESQKFNKCIEAQIMDLADDISYCVHDVEDAIVSSSLQLDMLKSRTNQKIIIDTAKSWYGYTGDEKLLFDAFNRLENEGFFDITFDSSRSAFAKLKNLTSTLIGRFCTAVVNETIAKYGDIELIRYNANLEIPQNTQFEIMVLKAFAATFIMIPKEESSSHSFEQNIIFGLVDVFKNGENLAKEFLDDYQIANSDDQKLRVVVDQIASLTDASAKKIAEQL